MVKEQRALYLLEGNGSRQRALHESKKSQFHES